MGLVLDDSDNGIHCEARRKSVVLLTDFGDQRVELTLPQLDEAILLLLKARDRYVDIASTVDDVAREAVSQLLELIAYEDFVNDLEVDTAAAETARFLQLIVDKGTCSKSSE